MTYEFNVIQNYTGFIVNGISWIVNGEEFSSMFEPIMYQFPNAGNYDIDVEMFGGQQDMDDYSSDSGLQSELVLFTLEVSSPSGSSEYSSGTEEVAFNDLIANIKVVYKTCSKCGITLCIKCHERELKKEKKKNGKRK